MPTFTAIQEMQSSVEQSRKSEVEMDPENLVSEKSYSVLN